MGALRFHRHRERNQWRESERSQNTLTVVEGDTLSVIAKNAGIKTSTLRVWNNLKSDKIVVGQCLCLAPESDVDKIKSKRHLPGNRRTGRLLFARQVPFGPLTSEQLTFWKRAADQSEGSSTSLFKTKAAYKSPRTRVVKTDPCILSVRENQNSDKSYAYASQPWEMVKRILPGVERGAPSKMGARTKFHTPVKSAELTSTFGPRWGSFHNGIDLAVDIGTLFRASAGGKVAYIGWDPGYGNLIDIEHEGGFMTRYAHCNKIKKSTGDTIRRGEVLGETGNSGRSTGPHLHFEIRKDYVPVDPLEYIILQ